MKYIALLRGINVGGNKKIKMGDLRDLLTANGFKNVKTYIQSGNVAFENTTETVADLGDKMMNLIQEKYGFEVKIILKTAIEIKKITNDIPDFVLQDLPLNFVFAILLDSIPQKEKVEVFLVQDFSPDKIAIQNDVVYLACPNGISNSKFGTNIIEKQLKVSSTARNFKTMQKLITM
jgi:uncharacterized protein (DUF1697 family)